MMISDSLPQMWLIYFGLAAVVLFTGYMAVRILPRFLRWILVGGIAGMIAVPTSFHVTASVAEDAYTGLAPAIVAFAVSVVQKDGGGMASAFGMLVLGIGAGVVLGLVIWWLGRGREQRRRAAQQRREALGAHHPPHGPAGARGGPPPPAEGPARGRYFLVSTGLMRRSVPLINPG